MGMLLGSLTLKMNKLIFLKCTLHSSSIMWMMVSFIQRDDVPTMHDDTCPQQVWKISRENLCVRVESSAHACKLKIRIASCKRYCTTCLTNVSLFIKSSWKALWSNDPRNKLQPQRVFQGLAWNTDGFTTVFFFQVAGLSLLKKSLEIGYVKEQNTKKLPSFITKLSWSGLEVYSANISLVKRRQLTSRKTSCLISCLNSLSFFCTVTPIDVQKPTDPWKYFKHKLFIALKAYYFECGASKWSQHSSFCLRL